MPEAAAPDPAPVASPEEPATAVERATAELRRALFEGELESGTPLREHALAESLGVARSTVREALTVLVGEGLATRQPHKGVAVMTPAAGAVRDVCNARIVLEGAGVRQWPEASEHARERVRRRLTEYAAAVTDQASYQTLNERHLAFHLSLVELTENPRLVQMQRTLVVELRLALAQVDRIRRNAHDQAESHSALVALLDDGRIEGEDGAVEFLRRHLEGAATEICAALGLLSRMPPRFSGSS